MVSNASEDFPGPAQSGDHRQGIARDFDVDVLQIVLARAMHGDPVQHSDLSIWE